MTVSRYVSAPYWGHCFEASREDVVRFVYDTQAATLFAQVKREGWQTLAGAELDDLRAELDDNDLLTDFDQLDHSAQLPAWAVPFLAAPPPAVRSPRPR